MRITIVVPVLDEERVIPYALDRLRRLRPAPEIVVVDGGSTDRTWRILESEPGIVRVQTPRGRARQMNAGARRATGDLLLFLHADTALPQVSYAACRSAAAERIEWGWFDVRFDEARLSYRMHAWLISQRAALLRSPTGDQAVFVRRELFLELGGYPDMPLMEDIAFVGVLRRRGRGARIRPPVITSARRWRQWGLVRTVLRMWSLKVQYLAGRDPARLAELYPHVR